MKRVRLFDHQTEGIERIVHGLQHGILDNKATRAFLLHDEMGLGKTIQAMEATRRMQLSLPTLVVCPASCEAIWTGQTGSDHFKPIIYSHKAFGRLHLTPQTMVVISYDMLRNVYKYYIEEKFAQGGLTNDELIRFCLIHGKNVSNRTKFLRGDDLRRELIDISRTIKQDSVKVKPYAPALLKQKWGMLILDEVHRIRSSTSGITKAVGFVDAMYRLALSGTPIVNNGQDLLNIWRFGLGLHHLDWACIRNRPDSEYCRNIIDTVSLGRRKDDVEGLPLPKRDKKAEDVVISWQRDTSQKAVYIDIKRDSLQCLKEYELIRRMPGESDSEYQRRRLSLQQTFLGRMQRLRQVCLHKRLPLVMKDGSPQEPVGAHWSPASHRSFNHYTQTCVYALLCGLHRNGVVLQSIRNRIIAHYVAHCQAIVPSTKMLAVYDLLKVHPDKKIVVFSTFRVFLERIMRRWLKQIGVKSMLFAGGSKKYQREALQVFRDEADVRVLLVVKGAGSEGLNLQCAGACVIMDPHFNQAMDEQAAQRIDRIGQQHDEVIIRRLYMEGSIDQAMQMLQNDKISGMNGWTTSAGARSLKAQGLFLQKRDTVQ